MDCIITPNGSFSKEEYETLISQFLERELLIKPASKESLLESLSAFFSGTKETRYGRMPSPEVLATIRDYIRGQIEHDRPIVVLVPWGGKKPFNGSVDTAELSAVKMLNNLADLVKKVYTPGLEIHVRIEDLGAEWLYKPDYSVSVGPVPLIADIAQYSADTKKLVQFFNIIPHSEYDMMCRTTYFALSSRLTPLFIDYITESDRTVPNLELQSFIPLSREGWRGAIPMEQRNYYRDRYKELYSIGDAKATEYLARYFAGSLARHQLNGTGLPSGTSHIQVTFAPPIPGIPSTMFRNTVYMRTIPESHGRTHISPWRAKGYIQIKRGDTPVFKLASPNQIPAGLTKASVVIRHGDERVVLQSDYLLE